MHYIHLDIRIIAPLKVSDAEPAAVAFSVAPAALPRVIDKPSAALQIINVFAGMPVPLTACPIWIELKLFALLTFALPFVVAQAKTVTGAGNDSTLKK